MLVSWLPWLRLAIAYQQSLTRPFYDMTACYRLSLELRELVTFPHSPRFAKEADTYWAANQGHLHPSCYVSPRSTSDLITALHILHTDPSPFSVRSGGHSSVPSTSNIADGITIDLSALNSISISPDHETIAVGAGVRWTDVYHALLPYSGLAVSGARMGEVGGGGYLLGGGLSIFSSLHGWACDSIVSMEVLLPNATLIRSSRDTHSSLFTALKGTSSNLGIITSFTLNLTTLPTAQTSFDVIVLSYAFTQLTSILSLLTAFSTNAPSDPKTSISISLATSPTSQPLLIVSIQSLLSRRTPTVLRPFFFLEPINIIYETMSQFTFGKLVTDSNPSGFCQHKSTFTSLNNASYASSFATSYLSLFTNSTNSTNIQADAAFQAALLIQPLTLPHLHASRLNKNPNMMGLEEETSPLLLYSFEIRHTYNLTTDHLIFPKVLDTFIDDHLDDSQAHPFRYINYASEHQDIYGALKRDEGKWEWLNQVKKEYDPDGWWSTWNGGIGGPFKIN